MKRTKISDLLKGKGLGEKVMANGWVRTFRNDMFIALNDGSSIKNLQCVTHEGQNLKLYAGTCICVEGTLKESQGKGQDYELVTDSVTILGEADPAQYPLQPKEHSLEFLREIAHLRIRTNLFGAVMRVRSTLAQGVHKFFAERGFYYFNAPIITGSDCEGAGEMFGVSVLPHADAPKDENGAVDFSKDFFARQTNLTVSGQLEAETYAMALGQVYTFGPTFRAENSNTSRHLAEFWMIEPEVAFADLEDNMELGESFIKYVIGYAMEHCADDIAFLDARFAKEESKKPTAERSDMGLTEKLNFILHNDFKRVSYTEAIDILLNSKAQKKGKFKYPVEGWGMDLQSEHERYLVEKHFGCPVILYDYPSEIKAFYMRQNEDGKTVRAMDILFPGIGEIIGGSQREERMDVLMKKVNDLGMDEKTLWWYLDTRRFGSAPHSGFGLGFERLVMFVTGMGNIRDVIPFPRYPQNAEF
ncbi:MAG: asparagine--tRNA ligase [Flavobacteriales bacterium]|nr:asparagine--tRNA ligase [Flavobacteriales bacterium]